MNLPIVDDRLDLRIAGEWTKRKGYETNQETGQSVDGRDLWSGRVTLGWKPFESVQSYLVWEHFSENDNRARSTKQLCTRAPLPSVVEGPAGPQVPTYSSNNGNTGAYFLSQGCQAGPLYGPTSFETPNAAGLPFIVANELTGDAFIPEGTDPYAGQVQSQDLRVVGSLLEPHYHAKNDIFEFNTDYKISDSLTLTSQTGYNQDFYIRPRTTTDSIRTQTYSSTLLQMAPPGSSMEA